MMTNIYAHHHKVIKNHNTVSLFYQNRYILTTADKLKAEWLNFSAFNYLTYFKTMHHTLINNNYFTKLIYSHPWQDIIL